MTVLFLVGANTPRCILWNTRFDDNEAPGGSIGVSEGSGTERRCHEPGLPIRWLWVLWRHCARIYVEANSKLSSGGHERATNRVERVDLISGGIDTPDCLAFGDNVCYIYGRSGARARVLKSVPYSRNDLTEGLIYRDRPLVELFCSSRITMMVFICVDFLMDSLRDLARDLDVSLVLIPSMSAKSQVFHGLIDGHVAATQSTTVVFANALQSRDEDSVGNFASPLLPSGQLIDAEFRGLDQGSYGVSTFDIEDPDGSGWTPLAEATT